MKVEVTAAGKHEAALVENLMQLYLHDFTEFEAQDIGPDGRYHYPYLPHYWEDPDRHPFLFRVDGQLAGFALLRRETDPQNGKQAMDVAEFFILRNYRLKGIGEQVARQLWDEFPGDWQVRVLKSNEPAGKFWKRVIGSYTGETFDETGSGAAQENWTVFSFRSKG